MKNKYRFLKIYSKFQKRVYDEKRIPEIRLNGVWLKELGFCEGMVVKIEQRVKKLIITLKE